MTTVLERPASGTPTTVRIEHLRALKLGEVRSWLSPVVYQRSPARALGALAIDLVLYGACLAGVVLAPNVWLQLLCGVLAGAAVAFLFVWGHDAAHGSLFRNPVVSEVLGTVALFPSLHAYRLWQHGHNRVHHGFTSLSPVDWIWRPHTPAEYAAASRWSRLVYRVERSLPGSVVHYLLRVWWPGMVTFHPEKAVRRKYHVTGAKLLVLAWLVAASALAWIYAGGLWGVVAAVVVPFVVFTYFIAVVVYLNHTHPTLPFFDTRKEWSASIGQVGCSTVVRTSGLFEALSHRILVHTPHHVDTRIPFYRLQTAWDDLRPHVGDDVCEYRFRWRTVWGIFSTCQLFDFRTKTWYRFADVGRAERS